MRQSEKAAYLRLFGMARWEYLNSTRTPRKVWETLTEGSPVPRTGKRNRRKYKNGAGVSANSRILSHHYADEGEKGQAHRREIRRRERILWRLEWEDEQHSEIMEMCAYDSWE